VKPEAAEHLDRAAEYLTKARSLLDVLHYNDEAGRAAYLAALHAAQALIFERTGHVARSHGGINSQFNLQTRGDRRVDAELRRFLPHAYDLKAVADYEAGPGSVVPLGRAEAAQPESARVCRQRAVRRARFWQLRPGRTIRAAGSHFNFAHAVTFQPCADNERPRAVAVQGAGRR
jgi:uncharacterized protein (UPF0332 family)